MKTNETAHGAGSTGGESVIVMEDSDQRQWSEGPAVNVSVPTTLP